MAMLPPDHKRLIYIADPMCSWCYGFAPSMEALARHFGDRLPIGVLTGGLRAGYATPMSESDKEVMRGHWERVTQASGQPFDFGFFDRAGYVYDTEPACRAVVTMRRLHPQLTLSFQDRIQEAFYAQNRDVTQSPVLGELAGDAGVDPQLFEAELASAQSRSDTMRDFLIVQELGVQGFPTLLAGSEQDGWAVVTNGFRPLDGIADALERWLAGTIH
jgi:putative protein-disulfide isomerase